MVKVKYYLQTEMFMKVSYTMDKCKATESWKNIQSIFMKDILLKTNFMGKAKKYTKMEEFMKENSKMEKNKELEN